MRGGVNGFKGFLTEELQATEASIAGKSTTVLNNNGIADLEYIGKNGHRYYQQVKTGYKPGQIDFAKYKGQTIVVDKGNPYLKTFQAEARKHGIKVVEGDFTNQGAKDISNLMQAETHLTGSKTSSAVTSGIKAKGVVSASHKAGLSSAKTGAQFGGGFSLGTNLVDVLNGDKSVGEAADDVVVDTVVAGAVGYGVGAAATAVGSTTVGAAALSTAGTVGSTIAGTAVGGTVLGAGAATAATIGGAGAAATGTAIGAVGAVGSAIGSTAVAATAGTAIGGTVAAGVAGASAAGAAIGAAAVAAAPVVAVGAALGAAFKFLDWLCDD